MKHVAHGFVSKLQVVFEGNIYWFVSQSTVQIDVYCVSICQELQRVKGKGLPPRWPMGFRVG